MAGAPRYIGLVNQNGAAALLLLMVLGLGASALLISAVSALQLDMLRERKTIVALAEAKEALIGYAVLNGRLPRPAQSPVDGKENTAPCKSEASCTGFIPWIALGIEGADGWGKLLHYSVTPAFTKSPLNSFGAVATKKIVGRAADGEPYYRVGLATCDLNARCVPAVVFSNGKNNLGTSVHGTSLKNLSVTNIDEVSNNTASSDFFARAFESNPATPGGEFGALVDWLSTPILYRRMSAAGALHSYNAYGPGPTIIPTPTP